MIKSFVLILFYLSSYLSIVHAAEISRINLAEKRPMHYSTSADGRFIAFSSDASNLVSNDVNGKRDVFIFDQETDSIELISISSRGIQANNASRKPSISADGRFVAFGSYANNLVPNDTNNFIDIFIHDRFLKKTERVNVSSTGEQTQYVFASLQEFKISADGRFVAFSSRAINLAPDDTGNIVDIFVHDRELGITERVSLSSNNTQGNNDSYNPSISADGRFVAFKSFANNLVTNDDNMQSDIFVHDRETNETERVSLNSAGEQVQGENYLGKPVISPDGRFVAFESLAVNLVDDDTNGQVDIFVRDRELGITERVSVSSDGTQGNRRSIVPTISDNGRYVAFESASSNLVSDDTNNLPDIFVHDRSEGKTKRVNVSLTEMQADSFSYDPFISGDGRYLLFYSYSSNLVPSDKNNRNDLFIAENQLLIDNYDLNVTVSPPSHVTEVGEYVRFRATLTNVGNNELTNCRALIVNPLINWQRQFSYFSWPLNTANPEINGSIDLAPDGSGEIQLTVLPRDLLRKEVRFKYVCNNTQAFTIPFVNSVHLTSKNLPFMAEDYVRLETGGKSSLIVDRTDGKYWTPYAFKVINNGSLPANIRLSAFTDISGDILGQPRLCEPVNPTSGNWSCLAARDTQIQVNLETGESKRVLVFVHAKQPVEKRRAKNRVFFEARDQVGEIVSKNSIGVYTIN